MKFKSSAKSRLWCDECGEVRVRAATGMVCPNGHGRIHEPATQNQIKAAQRLKWSRDLPVAEKAGPGRYRIQGHPGEYQIVHYSVDKLGKKSRRVPTGATAQLGVIAVILGQNVLVRKFREIV